MFVLLLVFGVCLFTWCLCSLHAYGVCSSICPMCLFFTCIYFFLLLAHCACFLYMVFVLFCIWCLSFYLPMVFVPSLAHCVSSITSQWCRFVSLAHCVCHFLAYGYSFFSLTHCVSYFICILCFCFSLAIGVCSFTYP